MSDQFRHAAKRLLSRATNTGGRFVVLLMDDETCRVMLVEDAELLIARGRAGWVHVVGTYDGSASVEDVLEDLQAAQKQRAKWMV